MTDTPSIAWRDLVPLNRGEITRELTLSLPWLAGSLVAAGYAAWPLALALSFLFFLTGLRQVHNAYHEALGVPRRAGDVLLAAMSVAMLGSMHAVRVNHLRHHKDCLGPGDVEAASAKLPAWRALLTGPAFPFALVTNALRVGNERDRRWIRAELALNAGWAALVFGLRVPALEYHLAAMAVGQSLSAFFCVWTVHHDVGDAPLPARTLRHGLLNRLSYSMFYHAEHHLYPRVPTCHLGRLAARIDAVAPELASLRVVDVPGRGRTGDPVATGLSFR